MYIFKSIDDYIIISNSIYNFQIKHRSKIYPFNCLNTHGHARARSHTMGSIIENEFNRKGQTKKNDLPKSNLIYIQSFY